MEDNGLGPRLLEVCVDQIEAILPALDAGARRIELCSRLDLDGLSPSLDDFQRAVVAVDSSLDNQDDLPLQIMVRLSTDSFLYSDDQILEMENYIHAVKSLADSLLQTLVLKHPRRRVLTGFVFGCLSLSPSSSAPHWEVHKAHTERLTSAARPYSVTFHRAFDLIQNRLQALEILHQLGVDRVLTSGGPGSVDKNMDSLKQLLHLSHKLSSEPHKRRIIVLPGGGVRAHNAQALLELGAQELHSSVPFNITAVE